MQNISPYLWFDTNAEEAMHFYTSTFKNSKIGTISRYGDAGPGPSGSVMLVTFVLDGQEFIALNGGPMFKSSPGVSFFVKCHSQQEVDDLWEKLSQGGEPGRCGWVKDKFGISWNIVPTILTELLQDKDAARSKRVMQAMLKMGKLEIAGLKQAYEAD